MAVAVLDSPRVATPSFARWRTHTSAIILWSAVLLLVVYPLLMVVLGCLRRRFPQVTRSGLRIS